MILRILRGRTHSDDVARLIETVRADAAEWAAMKAGLVAFQPAVRQIDDGLEFLIVSTWADAEAVIARGGQISLPRGRLGDDPGLRGARAAHYELMMGIAHDDAGPPEVLRLSTIALDPKRSSAFYGQVRWLWGELVGDSGLVALHVGRRAGGGAEHAVVVSIWNSAEALEAATSGGFVGGEEMQAFYAGAPTIEHFEPLRVR